MLIHSAVITGSVQLNNTDVSSITNVAGFATTASVDSLVVKTGSYATTSSVNNLQSVTGSYATTSSFDAYTGSNDTTNTTQNTRLSTIESVTGSYATTSSVNNLQSVTGSYATTGSNQFNGNQSISGSITSNGTITAQTLVVQTVTSSVEFVTGSTRNGSLSSNTHEFTGSLFQTGSTAAFMGNVGIGTTTPESKFNIFDSTNLGGTTGNYLLLQTLQNVGGAGGNNVYERTWAYRTGTGTDWQTYSLWTGVSVDVSFGTPTISKTWHWREILAEKQHFGSGTTNVMTIGPSNVGIGTTSPSFKLDVAGTSKFGTTTANTHQFTGSVLMTGSLTVVTMGTEFQVNAGGVNIGNALTDNHIVSGSVTINTNALFVSSSGNVGIGNISPGLNLSVQGLYGLPTTSGAQTGGILRVQDSASNIALDMGVIQNFGNWIQSINKVNSSVLILALNPNGGNVGIGTSTPSGISTYTTLDIRGATGGGIRMGVSSSSTPFNLQQAGTDAYLNNVANGSIIFYTNDTLRAQITNTGVFQPGANGTQDLGTSSLRWGTIYTSDLSLSNGIGDYTIVEGEEKLYLYNNKNNKVYSFVLQEEDPLTATPKKS